MRLSKTLTDSPVCLVADDDGMDIQMERLMKAHNKDFVVRCRILELNPSHGLITGLKDKIKADQDPELVHDACLCCLIRPKFWKANR